MELQLKSVYLILSNINMIVDDRTSMQTTELILDAEEITQ